MIQNPAIPDNTPPATFPLVSAEACTCCGRALSQGYDVPYVGVVGPRCVRKYAALAAALARLDGLTITPAHPVEARHAVNNLVLVLRNRIGYAVELVDQADGSKSIRVGARTREYGKVCKTWKERRAEFERELQLAEAHLAVQQAAAPAPVLTQEAVAAMTLGERRTLAAEHGILTPSGKASTSVALIWAAVRAAQLVADAPAARALPSMAVRLTTGRPWAGRTVAALARRRGTWVSRSRARRAAPVRFEQPEQRHYARAAVQVGLNLNARINARSMPRERVEAAARQVAWLERQKKAAYDKAFAAGCVVAERNLHSWGCYEEDLGAGRAWRQEHDSGAHAMAEEVVEAGCWDGRIEHQKAVLRNALQDWGVQEACPAWWVLESQLRFRSDMYAFYYRETGGYRDGITPAFGASPLRWVAAYSRAHTLRVRALPWSDGPHEQPEPATPAPVVLVDCAECEGEGRAWYDVGRESDGTPIEARLTCAVCHGEGKVPVVCPECLDTAIALVASNWDYSHEWCLKCALYAIEHGDGYTPEQVAEIRAQAVAAGLLVPQPQPEQQQAQRALQVPSGKDADTLYRLRASPAADILHELRDLATGAQTGTPELRRDCEMAFAGAWYAVGGAVRTASGYAHQFIQQEVDL